MNTLISWFEIPTADLERGIRFYETVMGVKLKRESMGPMQMAVFPYEEGVSVGGALTFMPDGQQPGGRGSIVYLYAGDDLSIVLARVEPAGGGVIVAKTLISPEMGYFAVFCDSEGNHVGLYSMH
jgi:predicted enzyme related to lactoylglutathione lyase